MSDPNAGRWAIVWVDLAAGPIELDALREATATLDEVGAILALREEVSGVQSFTAAESPTQRPRLCIYTRPEAIEPLHGVVAELLENFGLTGTTRAEVRDDEEWKDAWKAYYKPLTFGEHQLLLRPSWIDRQPGDPELEVVLDPGRAFGTGLHQTTQLCLHRLCALARTGAAPASVFDLGCGSGILSMAAARLFPATSRMLAVDIDPEATATTVENLELASLHERIDVQTGMLEDLPAERFDLVVANIRPIVLIPAAPLLRERLAPGATITLSGILGEELDRVFEAYDAAGFVLDETAGGGRRHLDTWSALDLVVR
ncbi:MAG: 50S ribosomal protein L11 methyltransferase [Myxococcota bacterium]